MDNTLQLIINIIVSIGGIPWIVNLIKKWFDPKAGRFAPIIVVVLAAIYVVIGKSLGVDLDFQGTVNQLLLILGLSGGAVLAYDTVKTTVKGK